MRKIILANGIQDRWSGGIPKQLLKIKGQELILDIIDKFGADCILFAHNEEIVKKAKLHNINLGETKSTCETLEKALETFGEDSYLVLLGDVYFDDNDVDIIMRSNEDEFIFFLRGWDIYGLYIPRDWFLKVFRNLVLVNNDELDGEHKGKLNDLYAKMFGLPRRKVRDKYFKTLGEKTVDFDRLKDYNNFK